VIVSRDAGEQTRNPVVDGPFTTAAAANAIYARIRRSADLMERPRIDRDRTEFDCSRSPGLVTV
jgi:hypothetical protein